MSESKNKKRKYNHKKTLRFNIQTGIKGFMCTCNFSEKACIKEAYNLLNLYSDELYGSLQNESLSKHTEDTEGDICDDLNAELKQLETKKIQYRFQAVESGAKNCVFIQTTLENPVELATAIASKIDASKQQQSRNLLRLVPIETICKATSANVIEHIKPLLLKHFSTEPKTYGIVFNRRNNDAVNKDEIISKIASSVIELNSEHKVNLNQPEISIVVEIIRSWCLLSVIPNYFKLKKYNLLELSIVKNPQNIGSTYECNTNNENKKDVIFTDKDV